MRNIWFSSSNIWTRQRCNVNKTTWHQGTRCCVRQMKVQDHRLMLCKWWTIMNHNDALQKKPSFLVLFHQLATKNSLFWKLFFVPTWYVICHIANTIHTCTDFPLRISLWAQSTAKIKFYQCQKCIVSTVGLSVKQRGGSSKKSAKQPIISASATLPSRKNMFWGFFGVFWVLINEAWGATIIC